MSEYIGSVPIATINEIQLSSEVEVEEMDIVGEDSNFVIVGENLSDDIEISYTLTKQNHHPENADIEEQREDIKSLISEDAKNNSIRYGDELEGFVSVEDTDISEDSNLQTIREGTISGKFLPHPKHFPEQSVGPRKLNKGNINYVLEISGKMISHVYSEGDVNYILNFSGDPEPFIFREGETNFVFSLFSYQKFGNDFGDWFEYSDPELTVYSVGDYGYQTYNSGLYGVESSEQGEYSFEVYDDGIYNG